MISDAYKFILPVPKSEGKLEIINDTDQVEESVSVDGKGVIIFNFTSYQQAVKKSDAIEKLINEQLLNKDIKDILTIQDIKSIVSKARTQLDLKDIYPSDRDCLL